MHLTRSRNLTVNFRWYDDDEGLRLQFQHDDGYWNNITVDNADGRVADVAILQGKNIEYQIGPAEEEWPDETVELTDEAPGWEGPSSVVSLEDDLRAAINKHSRENSSDTPDFVLADYLIGCLHSYENAVANREKFAKGEANSHPFAG